MLVTRRLSLGLIALTASASLASPPAVAQLATCSYVRCFLSPQRHPPRVVQGAAATPVADFGFFAPHIDLLASHVDSARIQYEAFRSAYNRGAIFRLASITAGIAELIVFAANPKANHGLAIGMAGVTVPVWITAMVYSGKAQGHLERAIGYYNRTLPDTP